MTKKLAVPMLILGLALYGGCGSSSSSNTGGSGGSTGGSGGSTGGSGGSTGGSGGATGGSGGATGGSGGATGGAGGSTGGAGGTTDGGAADTGAGDTGAGDTGMMGDTPPTADFCAGYVAGSGMLAGKSAADFCAEYATVCTFTGDMRYMTMGDCVTKYGAATAAGQTCRAGHLCNAKTGDKTVHCPHATGLSVCQ